MTIVGPALAAALLLAGCGGGSDPGTPTSAGSSTSGAQQQGSTRSDQGKDGSGKGGSGQSGGAGARQGGGGNGQGGSSSSGKALDTSNLPPPQEGSKKAAPGVPVSKGGDNSIQTWGLEASSAEREQVTAVVQAFLDARANADWARACTYLAAKPRREYEGLIKDSKKKGNAACAETMAALARGVPASAFEDEAMIDYVLSLRVKDDTAFLIYTRSDDGGRKIYATALSYEDGAWKVISVGPTALS